MLNPGQAEPRASKLIADGPQNLDVGQALGDFVQRAAQHGSH